MSTDYFGFRFEIVSVKEMWMNNGEAAYVIFFNITNLEPKARIVTLSTATYVTKDGEQLEQDLWLLGYVPADGTHRARIKGNAHRKAGFVFYKKHLSSVVSLDSLYVDVALEDSKKKLSLRFDNTTAEGTATWPIVEAQVEEMEVRASPRVLSKALTRKVERLEAFEERLGISLDKLSVNVQEHYLWLTVSGEVHQASSGSLSRDVKIVAVVYDAEGTIVETGEVTFYARDFVGFDVFKLTLHAHEICLIADKIRIFPKAY